MTQKRSRNAILNIASSIVFTGATLVGALFSSRLIIQWVGESRFGAFKTLSDYFAYLAILEFGLGGAIGPLLARSLGSDDRHSLTEYLAAGMRAYFLVMGLAIAVGLALIAALPWLVPVPPPVRLDLRVGGLICLLTFGTLPLLPLRALAEADQRGYEINLLLLGQFLIITASAILLCWYFPDWSITSQSAALALGMFTFNAALLVLTIRRHPGVLTDLTRTRPGPGVWGGLWAMSWPSLVLNVAGRIGQQSDSIILSQFWGTSAVTSLFVTQRLAQLAQQQISSVGSASWAALAELNHRGEHDLFRRRLLELFRLLALFGMAGLAPIVAYNRHFVLLWMGSVKGPALYGGDLVVLTAAGDALALSLLGLSGWCMTGTGRVRKLAVPSIISTTINLTASIALTGRFGVAGPLLGTAVTIVTFSIWCHLYLLRAEFGISPGSVVRSVAPALAWGLPFGLACRWASASQDHIGWFGLIAQMGLASSAFLAFGALVILGPEERAAWRFRLGTLPGFSRLLGPREQVRAAR
jgi:O-antigen/teichoic acid export membrane protein